MKGKDQNEKNGAEMLFSIMQICYLEENLAL